MHFGDFPKAIITWVASLATAYTIVFLNAVSKGSRGLGATGTKVVLLAAGFAALLFLIRNSRTQWGVVVGSLLAVVAASHLVHRVRYSDESAQVTQQARLSGVPLACGLANCSPK